MRRQLFRITQCSLIGISDSMGSEKMAALLSVNKFHSLIYSGMAHTDRRLLVDFVLRSNLNSCLCHFDAHLIMIPSMTY